MFNNPLNSFHDTVAEAKEEREQLDRLLTISTPRERLLVVAIAVVLCVTLAWLFYGSVAHSIAVDGVLSASGLVEAPSGQVEVPAERGENGSVQVEAPAGQGEKSTVQVEAPAGQGEKSTVQVEAPAEGSRSVQALAWIDGGIAPQIEAGMPVVIEPDPADGEPGALGGTVRAISAVPFAGALAAFESGAPASVHRIDIALEESLDPDSLAGRKCRIVIELGRQSPITLFRMRRP